MLAVWLHGWATDERVFQPLAAALAARGDRLRVLAPPLAHWLDPAAPERWAGQCARRIEAERRGNEPLLLGGWSLGAMLALECAACHLERPPAGLVLLAGCARFVRAEADNPAGQDQRALQLMRRRLASAPERVRREFYGGLFGPEEVDARRRCALELEPGWLEQPSAWLEPGLRYLLGVDLRPLAAGLAVPSLLLHGAADQVIAPQLGRELAAALGGNARFEELEQAGHLCFWPDCTPAAAALAAFIDRLENGQRDND